MTRETGKLKVPSARETALLILHLVKSRAGELEGRDISRARISQTTVRKLCGRSEVPLQFINEVQTILLAAGWCFFCASHSHYALIKAKAVEGWARISSKRIKLDLDYACRGKFDFDALEGLLIEEAPLEEADD
jgi:hypothetical protein